MRGAQVAMAGLVLAVTLSALGVVYSQHRSRTLFVRLQQLQSERARLDTQWGRLELEQSTWAAQGRIERLARQRLDMRMPDFDRSEVIVLP